MSSNDESDSSSSGSQDSGSSSSNSGDSSSSPSSSSGSSSSSSDSSSSSSGSSSSSSDSSSSGSDSSSSNSPSSSSGDSQSNSPPSGDSSSSSGSQDSSSSSDSGDSQSNSTPSSPSDNGGSSNDNSGSNSSPPSQDNDGSSSNSPSSNDNDSSSSSLSSSSSSSSSPSPPSSSVPSPPSDSSSSSSSSSNTSPSPPQAISPPSSDGSKQSPSSNNSPSNSGNSNERTPSSSDNTNSSPSKHSSSSTTSSTDVLGNGHSNSGNGLIIGLLVIGIVLMILTICCIARKRRRKTLEAMDYRPPTSISIRSEGNYYGPTQTQGPNSGSYTQPPPYGVQGGSNRYGGHSGQFEPSGGGKSWFSYEELAHVTNGFSRENLIGEGGFGCVYKGVLNDGRKVAIKQLKAGSGQGEREFQAEVEIISRVHHRHLVSLCGYCMSQDHRLLVYEFLPNNTLEYHLHNKDLPPMDWSKRMKIAIGSAKGLAYLHEDCHPKIIHRDIKSANILLEESFEPQVADFGLAKLSNDTHTHVSTRIMGTFGYLAPEYASSGKLTDKSDVFSFGVVLLEILTGRKPVDSTQAYGDECLVEWARPLLVHALETGICDELVDPRLEGNYNKYEMFNMIEAAAACVRHSAPKRPRMVQVVRVLDSQDDIGPDLSNGVKYGQSQAFTPSEQGAMDMQRFRKMAFGNDTDSYGYDSGEYDRRSTAYSGEYRRDHKPPPPPPGMYHYSGGRNHL